MDEIDVSGEVLGKRFKVTKRLGVGRLGTVHMATDEKEGRTVVVKVPHPDLLADSGFRERFEEGARILLDDSPLSVVDVVEVGTWSGGSGEVSSEVPWVAVEYMEGGSLEDRLKGDPLTAEQVLEWLPAVANALDWLHGDDIVHRDVKPENILFDKKGNAHLSDFTITRALSKEPGASLPGGGDDTYGYTPPGVLSGSIRPAHDQYSLAAVVFRCIAGRRLYPHDPYLGVWTTLSKLLTPDVASAVEKALSVDPADRFESCGEFATAFAAGMTQAESSKAAPKAAAAEPLAEEPEEPTPPLIPKPAMKVLAGVAFAALLVVGLLAIPRGSSAPRASVPAAGPASGTGSSMIRLSLPVTGTVTSQATQRVEGRVDADGAVAVLVNDKRTEPDEHGRFHAVVELAEGVNTIQVRWVSGDGGGAPLEVDVTLDSEAPSIEILSPADATLTDVSWVELRGRVRDAHPEAVWLNGEKLQLAEDGTFGIALSLKEGPNRLLLEASDLMGNRALPETVTLTRDTVAPVVVIESPDSDLANGKELLVTGRVTDHHLARLKVNGEDVRTDEGAFSATVELTSAENEIEIIAEDAAGNVATVTKRVTVDVEPPTVVIAVPASGHRTADSSVVVRGTVRDDHPTHVVVNGETHEVRLGTFAVRVPLDEGENSVKITGWDGAGNYGETAILKVVRDTAPPTAIVSAEPSWTTSGRTLITGTLSEEGCDVKVQGKPVTVEGLKFSAEVELSPGLTDVEVVATDRFGNRSFAHAKAFHLRAGDSVSSGRTFFTGAGDRLTVSEDGRLVIAAGTEDGEVFKIGKGGVEGDIGESTVLELPAGRLTVPAGQRAVLSVVSRGRATTHVAVEKGRALFTNGDGVSVSLGGGQSLALRAAGEGYGFAFAVAEETRGKLYFFVKLTPEVRAQLWLEAGARGTLERSGLLTRVLSDRTSRDGAAFKVCTIRGVVAGAWTDVPPGASVRVRHASGRVELVQAAAGAE